MNFFRLISYLIYIRHAIIPLGLMVLFSVLKVTHAFLYLLLTPAIFDRLFVSYDSIVLAKILLLQLFLLLSIMFLDIISEITASHLQFKLAARIKVALLKRAFNFPYEFYGKISSGDMSKLIIADTDIVATGIKEIVMSFSYILQILLIAYGLYLKAMWLFKLYIILIMIFLLWNFIWKPIYAKAFAANANRNTKTYGFLFKMMNSFREIKILRLEEKMKRDFKHIQKKQKHSLWRSDTMGHWLHFLNNPLNAILYGLVIFFCIIKIKNGEYSLGMMAAYTSIIHIILAPVTYLTMSIANIESGMVGAKLLKNFKSTKAEPNGKKEYTNLKNGISIKNLSFSYSNDRKILDNINMFIPKGHHIGIVGQTGCGKSTLLALLLKLYHRYDGDILFDNCNIRDIDNKSIRNNLSYLGQDSISFMGTFRDNIDVNRDLEDKDILEICDSVQLSPLIDRLSYGLDSTASDSSMSGGEKQRLFIARAIAKGGEVFLFDEATSALDAQTEEIVLKNIDSLRSGKTCITVAHRVTNVKNCNTIFVMDNGRIVEHGTYESLLNQKGSFYRLFKEIEENKILEKAILEEEVVL